VSKRRDPRELDPAKTVTLEGPLVNGKKRNGEPLLRYTVRVISVRGRTLNEYQNVTSYERAVALMTKIAADRNLKMRNETTAY
jgi:hypothetical protein